MFFILIQNIRIDKIKHIFMFGIVYNLYNININNNNNFTGLQIMVQSVFEEKSISDCY
jgi:hypothetical protein